MDAFFEFFDTFLELVGFDTPLGIFWNGVAYAAFAAIIWAFQKNRHINQTVFVCGIVLGIYAYWFLHNHLLAINQGLIAISALLLLIKVSRFRTIMIMAVLTTAAVVWLMQHGYFANITAVIGTAGLVGIAFGLILIPFSFGFATLVVASVLLSIYSYDAAAWVFLLLNIYFACLNICNYKNARCPVQTT